MAKIPIRQIGQKNKALGWQQNRTEQKLNFCNCLVLFRLGKR